MVNDKFTILHRYGDLNCLRPKNLEAMMKDTVKKIPRSIGQALLGSTILWSSMVVANSQPLDLPRGPDVGRLAANCNIGPFPQTLCFDS